MNLKVANLETIQECYHYKIGTVKNQCYDYSIEFETGVNFILGEINDNGWLCSYTLSNAKYKSVKCNCYINNEMIPFYELKNMTYYVGHWELKRRNWYKTLKSSLDKFEGYKKLLECLEINETLYSKPFIHMNNWLLLCSCAIGISKGKRILCFPWISVIEVCIQSYRFNLLSKYAIENDIIIIIPTNKIDTYLREEIDYPYKIIDNDRVR